VGPKETFVALKIIETPRTFVEKLRLQDAHTCNLQKPRLQDP